VPGYVEVTQGQTFPDLTVPLVPFNGQPLLPVDGALVELEIWKYGGSGPTLGGQATINEDGTVTYQWADADVANAGVFLMRWKITYAPGSGNEETEFVPNGRPDVLRIYPWPPA
jgi:hypothetical protein